MEDSLDSYVFTIEDVFGGPDPDVLCGVKIMYTLVLCVNEKIVLCVRDVERSDPGGYGSYLISDH